MTDESTQETPPIPENPESKADWLQVANWYGFSREGFNALVKALEASS